MKVFLLFFILIFSLQSQSFQLNPILHSSVSEWNMNTPVFNPWVWVANRNEQFGDPKNLTFFHLNTSQFKVFKTENSCNYPQPFAWTESLETIHYYCNEKNPDDSSVSKIYKWNTSSGKSTINIDLPSFPNPWITTLDKDGNKNSKLDSFNQFCNPYHTNLKLDNSYLYCLRKEYEKKILEIYSYDLNKGTTKVILQKEVQSFDLYTYSDNEDIHVILEYSEYIDPSKPIPKMNIINTKNPNDSITRDTIPTPYGCLIDSQNNLLYVTNAIESILYVLDLKTGKELNKKKIPSINHGIFTNPEKKTLFLVSTKEISEYDIKTLKKGKSYNSSSFFIKNQKFRAQGTWKILYSNQFILKSIDEVDPDLSKPQLFLYDFKK